MALDAETFRSVFNVNFVDACISHFYNTLFFNIEWDQGNDSALSMKHINKFDLGTSRVKPSWCLKFSWSILFLIDVRSSDGYMIQLASAMRTSIRAIRNVVPASFQAK